MKNETWRNRRQRPRPEGIPSEFATLAVEVETRLRALLRQHRRRLGPPTLEEAQEEEDKLKELQPALEKQEDLLKGQPPNLEGTKKFEEELKKRQKGLHDFEDKLDQLKGFPLPPPGFDKLVRSFEDLLRDQEKLLRSFEDLLKRFRPCPPVLLTSFEDLLKDLEELLLSFMTLASFDGLGPQFATSFEDLLRELTSLLGSFEDLVKRDVPKNAQYISSFHELLGGDFGRTLPSLLNGFADLFMSGDAALIASFVDLLERYAGLLESFEGIIRGSAKKPAPGLIADFEALVGELEDMLATLEREIKRLPPPPNKPLTEKFEGLLRLLCGLLDSLEDLVKRNPSIPLIKSFEDKLHRLVELLKSFEDMVRSIPEAPLVESFQDLVHRYDRLRESFAKLVQEHGEGNAVLARSMVDLNKGHQDLLASLEELKSRFDPVPEELLRSNIKAADELLARQPELWDVLRAAGLEPDLYVDSLTRCAKILFELARIVARGTPPAARVAAGYRGLVRTLAKRVTETERNVAKSRDVSPYLADAVEDLRWRQQQLEERSKRIV